MRLVTVQIDFVCFFDLKTTLGKEIDMRTRGRPPEWLGGVGDMTYDSTGPPTPRENFLVKHI
jgi:hypothetical protein